jgi:hypothetical protein
MIHDTVVLWRQKAARSRQLESEVRTPSIGVNCLISYCIVFYSAVQHSVQSWLRCIVMRNWHKVTWVTEKRKMYWNAAWHSSARNITLLGNISQNLSCLNITSHHTQFHPSFALNATPGCSSPLLRWMCCRSLGRASTTGGRGSTTGTSSDPTTSSYSFL